MAELPDDPTGWELEDFIAAHFVSVGCYVETGIKERNPDELLELDIVWTDYRKDPPVAHPVEVKSGDWGLGDVFKFFGWTSYLGLEPGEFVHKQPCGRVDPKSLAHVSKKTGIKLLHVPEPSDAQSHFESTLGLPQPSWTDLPQLWRFSFWAQRRLLRALSVAIKKNVCPECAKRAKEYHLLINDAVFFVADIPDRIDHLLSSHFSHPQLAKSAAYELESGKLNLADPPESQTFKRALFNGQSFPTQACLYLAHRARLYILKAVVDFWIARERGDIKRAQVKFSDALIDVSSARLTMAMANGIEALSAARSFRLFPFFWQVFLWSWGGFILEDRKEEEYELLSKETGVPVKEIPTALGAFDAFFPVDGGWFRSPSGDSRRVVMLMPAAMRGIGAFRRLAMANVDKYSKLKYADFTGGRLASDHDAGARLLNCQEDDLAR